MEWPFWRTWSRVGVEKVPEGRDKFFPAAYRYGTVGKSLVNLGHTKVVAWAEKG